MTRPRGHRTRGGVLSSRGATEMVGYRPRTSPAAEQLPVGRLAAAMAVSAALPAGLGSLLWIVPEVRPSVVVTRG